MTADDLAMRPATALLEGFRRKEFSPVETTTALIDRVEKSAATINAFTYTYFDEALAAAREAESRYIGKGEAPRPLEGLCVAIKDSGHIAGKPTSAGSLTMTDAPQPATSPINQRVLEAGGIVHARSATPEFSCALFTRSRRWGVTRNPLNTDYSPGGSSGGAAAALASGSTSLATGSDIAGSIRVPASCCGVVGYKPPKGRTPVDVPFNLDFYCHTGPLARTVADTILFQNVLAGPHPEDATTLSPKKTIAVDQPPVKGLRIALSIDLGFYAVDPVVEANTRAMAEILREAGAVVEEISLDWDISLEKAAEDHLVHVFGTSIAPALEASEMMTDYARAFAERSLSSSPVDYLRALETAGRVGGQFARAMAGYDALICPTTAIPGIPATFDPLTEPMVINGESRSPFLGWVMTPPFNMLSSHPVLSVPSGFAPTGVATGVQIVGRPYDDDMVFRIGLVLEKG
ncbi:MAG: amidase [Candidatus Puniceispirillales bacterium]